ncbi:MAG: hypothetical protein ACI9ON_002522 [Limisphaerales bacterium]|jgi:hypothetical protein
MNIELRLRRVEAAEKIRILKADYCELCDAGYPADQLTDLFTSDGAWDGGELGVFKGRDALHKFFSNMPKTMSFAVHHITNSAVEVSDDATTARARWYLLQTATLGKTNQAVWLAAQYEDQLVFKDNRWLFKYVQAKSRFYTTHAAGWAELPNLLENS